MDLKDICKCWSLIKTHALLVCNIIKMMPYNICSQMLHILLKTEKSFIAHPWCLLSVVGLEEYSAHDWQAATLVEWGLCPRPQIWPILLSQNSIKIKKIHHIHDHNLICSEGGEDTAACKISGHSLHAFSRKWPETPNLICFTKSK